MIILHTINIFRVIESNDPDYPVDSIVWSYFGWRDLTIFNNNSNKEKSANHIPPYVIGPIVNIPMSARLGVLGMTGLSAYFGLLDICSPQANEIIVPLVLLSGVVKRCRWCCWQYYW